MPGAITYETGRTRGRGFGPIVFAGFVALALLALWKLAVAPALPADPRRLFPVHPRLQWVAPDLGPFLSAERPERADVLFLGDSRVYNSIVPEVFERAGFGDVAVYTRGGAQLLELLAAARHYPARRLVVGLSPLSVWGGETPEQIAARRMPEPPGWTTAGVDERLGDRVQELVDPLVPRIDTATWGESWFPRPDPSASNASTRYGMRVQTRRERTRRLAEAMEEIEALRAEGWEVVCFRAPISESLFRIEDEAFESWRFDAACRAIGVPYFDYAREKLPTWDGSHVAERGAQLVSRRLAADIERVAGWGPH